MADLTTSPARPLTRRGLLTGAFAALGGSIVGGSAFSGSVLAQPHGPGRWIVLGTQGGEGVYRARWDAHTGVLGAAELAIATPRPSYLALHPRLPMLYACNEQEGSAAAVSEFHADRWSGSLALETQQPTGGDSPCFVSMDRTGRLLFTANYGGGSLSTFPLTTDGGLRPRAELFRCAEGHCGEPGPVHDRQDGAHLHCAVISPDNTAVLACDLGDDAILLFDIRPGGTPAVAQPKRLQARAGSGPRHLAFHPRGHAFYCIHELDCTVDSFAWSAASHAAFSSLRPAATVQLAPAASAGAAVANSGAEIAVSRDGRFVYTSVRGADQLSVLHVEPSDVLKLEIVQQIPCGGRTPRFFALDPTERWLLCAHQGSNSVTVFARDTVTGMLSPRETYVAPSPTCIVWL